MFQPGKIVLIVIPKIVLKELYYEKFAPPLSKHHLIKALQHQVRSSLLVVWRTYVSAGVIRPVWSSSSSDSSYTKWDNTISQRHSSFHVLPNCGHWIGMLLSENFFGLKIRLPRSLANSFYSKRQSSTRLLRRIVTHLWQKQTTETFRDNRIATAKVTSKLVLCLQFFFPTTKRCVWGKAATYYARNISSLYLLLF